jgi:hypothetical protein
VTSVYLSFRRRFLSLRRHHRRGRWGGLLLVAGVVLAGCGGSGHRGATNVTAGEPPATGATTTEAATTGTTTIAVSAATTTTAATPSGGSAPVSTTPAATTAPPAHTGSRRPSPTAAVHARLPATFTIGSGGTLSPPSVSAPSGVAIDLTVISGDGRAHRVLLGTRPSRSLSVPAGGRASILVSGLRNGSYPIEVDGATHGTVVIGVQPGP